MRALGIDPGTRKTGWGIVERRGTRVDFIAAGIIRPPTKASLDVRLHHIHDGLERVIQEHKPTIVAVEEIFFAKYPNAALKLGHARGVALLAAARAELRIEEYPPALVKRTIVGRGRATKDQVAAILGTILGLRDLPGEDATDALAVAMTHLQATRASYLQLAHSS